jgi:hypothetical protein
MVKYIKYVVILITLVVVGIIVFSFIEDPSPEKQIEKQVEKFLSNASKSSGDKLTTGLVKSKSLESLFAAHCKFYIGVSSFSGTYTPIQISSNAMRCRTMFKRVKFSAHDIQIHLTSANTATVNFTGSLSGLTKQGKSIENYKELTCDLQLIEGKWLISAVSVREIIKK